MAAPTTPTTAELADNIKSSIEASISQTTPMLPKSFVRVLSAAVAGVLTVLYRYSSWIFRQMLPSTADFDETDILGEQISPLGRWANLIGVGEPLTGTAAVLTFDITVNNQVGSLPVQTQILNPATGVVYLTTSAVLLNAATVQVSAVATTVGSVGNADDGTIMTFANPFGNVSRNVTVSATTTQGADAETVEQYRERVERRFRTRPQGGAAVDYVEWGEEIAGIESVLPYTGFPGQVNVYVEATESSSGNADGIPTTAQLNAVKNAVELDTTGLASRRPLGAYVNVLPITRQGFNVSVVGLSAPNLAATQADIERTLADYFASLTPFIPGVTPSPRADVVSTSAIEGLVYDVVSAGNGYFTGALLATEETPLTFISLFILDEGVKAALRNVSYS